MLGPTMALAASIAALVAVVLVRRSARDPDTRPVGARRVLWLLGLGSLAAGTVAAAIGGVLPVAPDRLGWVALPVVVLLVATGRLATRRVSQAGGVLLVDGVVAVPLLTLVVLVQYLARGSAATGADLAAVLATLVLFAVPAVATGVLFLGAGVHTGSVRDTNREGDGRPAVPSLRSGRIR